MSENNPELEGLLRECEIHLVFSADIIQKLIEKRAVRMRPITTAAFKHLYKVRANEWKIKGGWKSFEHTDE